jgi:mannitol/fructose-specific phosphotransferase system IIA component (Ntr-type)
MDAPLLQLAFVLVAGIIGGELVAKLKLPKVTGWIGTGILLRMLSSQSIRPLAEIFHVFTFVPNAENIGLFSPLSNFVLGYIAFTVGAALYLANLRNTGKRLGFLLLFEGLLTPAIVATLLLVLGPLIPVAGNFVIDSRVALILAAIAIAGAPGTTVLVVQEARAKGILTRTLVAAVALIDMVAVGVFVFMAAFQSEGTSWIEALLHVGVEFGITFAIGSACSLIGIALTRTIVGPAFLGPIMVAVILASWGLANVFSVTGILSCTFAGIVLSNVSHDSVRSTEAYLQTIGGALFAIFFTLAGMRLDFGLVPAAAGLVVLYFVARLIAKMTSSFCAMWLAEGPQELRNYLGLALMPHGGVAVGLLMIVQEHFNASEATITTITTVGLAALAINQLLGPSATRFSLIRANEDHKDRARLLDFLQEQTILVGLEGDTKEEVVQSLATLLYATSPMELPQQDFVARVMARENEETTCLGRGLMIPHAITESEHELRGVLGISSKGLDLGAPDGRPVHAVLLLVTPESERSHHLQVLAAFATAITRDMNLSEQLYHARSAAHAYNILHAEDAEDMNYFLEDAIERTGRLSR